MPKTVQSPSILALTLLFLAAPMVAESPEWAGFRGPGVDGIATQTAVFDAMPEVGLEVQWKRDLGAGYSGIAVADGRLITLFASGGQDVMAAFDADTGKELWRYAVAETYVGHDGSHDGPISTPLIVDGRVTGLGPRGQLFTLDAATGRELWRHDLEKDFGVPAPFYGFSTSPILMHGHLIVELGAGATVAAFDPVSGERRWTAGEDSVSYQTPIPWRLGDRDQLVAVGDKELMGIDPATGEQLWAWQHEGGGGRGAGSLTPVPSGPGRLFLAHQNDASVMVEVQADGAVETLWSERTIRNSYTVPIYHEGHLYAYSSRIFTCVDAATGEMKWRSREPSDGFLLMVDGHLVVATKKGAVHVVKASPEAYEPVAEVQVFDDVVWTAPSYVDGSIFVRSQGELARVDLKAAAQSVGTDLAAAGASEFLKFIAEVEAAEDDAKGAMVNRFLAAQESLPVVEGTWVHFVYRGAAEDVAVAGDPYGARREEAMRRIPGTDLFVHSFESQPGVRFNYLFIKDFEMITDPKNPRETVTTLLGSDMEMSFAGQELPMSWVALPGWEEPAHLAPAPEASRGSIESKELASKTLDGRNLDVHVYLPPGYDPHGDTRYPVAYVHDGASERMRQDMANSLDHLIGHSVAPVITVFLRIPARGADYGKVFQTEVLPFIDEHYRTVPEAASRANVGAAFSGIAALLNTLAQPDTFGKVGMFSPFLFSGQIQAVDQALAGFEAEPPHVYLDWGLYDFRNPQEAWDMGYEAEVLAGKLKDHGIDHAGGEVADGTGWSSWRNRTDRLFETLFPLAP